MATTIEIHDRERTRRAAGPLADDAVRGARLAAEIRGALRTASYVPEDDVCVEVRDHAVYLSGTVRWTHQRVAAERAVEHLDGVHVLRNCIRVMPRVSAAETRARVLAALRDNGSSDLQIDVDVDDEDVSLAGAVASYADRQLAEQAALGVPNVRTVCNQLRIVKA